MLDGACRRLDRGRCQRRSAAGREDRAVYAGRLRRSKERAEVLGILERVERDHERPLAAVAGAAEDVVQRRPLSRLDDERDALVAVEAGDRRQRAALDLDDGDAQRRGVKDERLERGAPLGHDQQSPRLAPRCERLLDRPTAGDELRVLLEQLVRSPASLILRRGPALFPGRAGVRTLVVAPRRLRLLPPRLRRPRVEAARRSIAAFVATAVLPAAAGGSPSLGSSFASLLPRS
jgi:hypothetical protein